MRFRARSDQNSGFQNMKAWMSSNLGWISPLTAELAALVVSEKLMYNLVSTLAPSV